MNMQQLFGPVLYTVLQLFLLMGLGFCLRKIANWSKDFFKQVSELLVRFALPAYFFVRLAGISLEAVRGAIVLPAMALIVCVVGLGISLPVFLLLPLSRTERRAGMALSSFGNSGYIPLTVAEFLPASSPLIAGAFGVQEPLLYISMYVLGFSPVLWLVGNTMVAGTVKRLRFRELISPPVLGILSGLLVPLLGLQEIFFNRELPVYHLMLAVERLGSVALPLVLIVLGAMIADLSIPKGHVGNYIKLTGTVIGIRFLIIPLLFFCAYFLIIRKIELPPAMIWVLFLELNTPPALNITVMSIRAGVNEKEVAFTMLFTYSLYLIILPIYLLIFLNLPGLLNF